MKKGQNSALNPWSPSPRPKSLTKPQKPLSPLVLGLLAYDLLERRRFHMPGHAGVCFSPELEQVLRDPLRYDLTELDGLDVLSEPSGCIKQAQQAAAEAVGVRNSFFLINGATAGLQAALLSCVKPGDKVLLPRNVHRSVLSGLILTGAEPVWFLPEPVEGWGHWGPVSLEAVKKQYQDNPDAKALVITSPTYEGLSSNVTEIGQFCRKVGLFLIVDEAHGSLWPFSDRLPASACQAPCDVVVHSLHKTGGSLTQAALAHLPNGSRIESTLFQQALNTLQSTSPSYLLMASLDAARAFLESEEGQQRIESLLDSALSLRRRLNNELQVLRLYEEKPGLSDPCKLFFNNPFQDNEGWAGHLESDCQLAFESASTAGVLYLANLGLRHEDFEVFFQAMQAEDVRLRTGSPALPNREPGLTRSGFSLPEMVLSPREAFFAPSEQVFSHNALNRVAKETVVHCPPGIPVLMPGERIREEHLPLLPPDGIWVVR